MGVVSTSTHVVAAEPPRPVAGRRSETVRLFAAAQVAAPAERDTLHEQIIRLNMPVARDVARRYRGRGIATDDLEQVAYLGLVKAVRGFEPDRGRDFLSYAVPTVRGELRRHFRDHGWAVRPPRSVQELQPRITAAEADLSQELGRSPRPSEVAARLGVELDRVLDSLAAHGCFAPASLDGSDLDDDEGPGHRLGDDDPGFARAEARVALRPLLKGLPSRDRLILEMRFVRGCTQAEIGREVGVTQMQVSRLLSGLLATLRQQIDVDAA